MDKDEKEKKTEIKEIKEIKEMKEKTIGFFGESVDKPRRPPDLTKFGALPGTPAWRKIYPKKPHVTDK